MPRKRRHYRTSSKSRTSSNDLFEIIFKLVLYLTIGVFILCFQGISWLIKTMSAHKKDKMVVSNIKTSKQDKLNVNVKSTYTTLKDCKICIKNLIQYYDFILNCSYIFEYVYYDIGEDLVELIDEMTVFYDKFNEFKAVQTMCEYKVSCFRNNNKFLGFFIV